MLKFPSSFFDEEFRDGFFISGMMKRAWAAQLELLCDIDRVCRKYNIKWFADCGTLLGAVRHGGYIPWDDDMDICMLRDDYIRFNEVASFELPKEYKILNLKNEENYYDYLTRVTNGNGINLEAEHLEKFHQFPFISGIDIMPLDYISPDEELENARKLVAGVVTKVIKQGDATSYNGYESTIAMIEEFTGGYIDKTLSPPKQLHMALELLYSVFPPSDEGYVALMPYWIKDNSHKYSVDLFKHIVNIPFENIRINVPASYDEVLKIEYGDYMRPAKMGGVHDYPYYLNHEKKLISMVGEYPYIYDISLEDINDMQLRECNNESAVTGDDVKSHVKEIVFIPYRYSTWSAMEGMWKEASKHENVKVHVIPIPYYERNMDGSFGTMHFEGELFADKLQITDFNTYDIEGRHPDAIVIQNPFDCYNYTTSVPPYFFTDKLKKYTDRLIYVPYFKLDSIDVSDENKMQIIRPLCISPGMVNADEVIVSTENMRQWHIEWLVKETGEDKRRIWESKIRVEAILAETLDKTVIKNSVINRYFDNIQDNNITIQDFYRLDGKAKKLIVYYISVYGFAQYGGMYLQKIKNSIEIFKSYKNDIVLILEQQDEVDDYLRSNNPLLYQMYMLFLDEYLRENTGVLDVNNYFLDNLEGVDAYYGDSSKYAYLCLQKGIPVMIQNVDIF